MMMMMMMMIFLRVLLTAHFLDIVHSQIGAVYTTETHNVFVQSWRDTRLRWVWSDYDGLDTLRVSPSRIWKPDLRLYNALVKLLLQFKSSTKWSKIATPVLIWL